MVSDDLLVLTRTVPCLGLDPVGEPFVKLGSHRLRKRPVGRVPNQDVGESEAVLFAQVRAVRPDEFLPAERLEKPAHLRPLFVGREFRDRPPPEPPPDDRRAFDHGALFLVKPVEPRDEKRVDRRRNLERGQVSCHRPASVASLQPAVIDQHPEQLLDEEGIALTRLCQARKRLSH